MSTFTWSFVTGYEGWTFSDESTGDTARTTPSRAYVTGAIRGTMHIVSGGSGAVCKGHHVSSTSLGVVITGGDNIVFEYTTSSNPIGAGDTVILQAHYTDFTVSQTIPPNASGGPRTLNLTAGKTLDFIRIVNQVSFSGGGGNYNSFRDFTEVRLTTANPLSPGAMSLARPLGIDVDLENGFKIWTSYWRNDTLFLREYSSDIVEQNTFSFGAATEGQITARIFYLVPYAPPFFGTASLEDIIYIFGRWDDGVVTHLEKSTDGGLTFMDIGDSATWGADWVGGFFADDASTLYAFVNGASPQLYRSLNGGTLWTSLSVMPFEVDPDGVSKHPDGRILIANRVNGAQMVAYADSAYAAWTNATGSPSFPTAGGGARSIVWVT